MIKEKEKAREGAPNDKDAKAEERREKRQRKKEEQERAKHQDADSERQGENDSRDSQVREQGSSRVCVSCRPTTIHLTLLEAGAHRKGWFVQG